jgi:cytochrome c
MEKRATSGNAIFASNDSSEEGPDKDAPAIVNAGMMGDRASIIFSSPEEISRFIVRGC